MKTVWALQDAKNGFSRLVHRAQKDGPQTITRHGREVAVIMSTEDYDQSLGRKDSLAEFFKKSPLKDAGIIIQRSKDLPRKVEL